MIIKDIPLLPLSLFRHRVKRKSGPPKADLLTIMDTPYMVLRNYKKLCRKLDIDPFAGGNHLKQGPSNIVGFITSGYRLETGIHGYGLALDMFVWPLSEQIRFIKTALENNLFTRAGFYPHHKVIHLDFASVAWMKRYGGRRFWVCEKIIIDKKVKRKYTSFDQLEEAIEFAEGVPKWKS